MGRCAPTATVTQVTVPRATPKERATDDALRALLAAQPRAALIPVPVAMCAILRERLHAADGDMDAIDDWVLRHWGHTEETMPFRSRPGADGLTREIPGKPYYVIPLSELRGGTRH